MCFNQQTSLALSALGLFGAAYAWVKTKNIKFVLGVFYFFLMEFLQALQYSVIDDCNNQYNQILTALGYLHICFQPYFAHMSLGATADKNDEKEEAQYGLVRRLCVVGGILMFARWPAASYIEGTVLPVRGTSTEWLRGNELCTFKGVYHLAWSVPLADPVYWLPTNFIHFFMMFMPFFLIKPYTVSRWLQGAVLMGTGPIIASFISPSLHEQPAIWCFFSILQILGGLMLYGSGGKIKNNKVD